MLIKKKNLGKYFKFDNYYETKLIDDNWTIEEYKNEGDFSSYIVTNTITDYTYVIDRVFGLEQISADEFVAFRRYGYGYLSDDFYYELLKYQLKENAIVVSQRLPEEYGWTPMDGDSSYSIIDVTHRKKKVKTSGN